MPGERQRLDKWLFFSRALKSRTLAQKLIESGAVRVNAERTLASDHRVGPGDVLTMTIGHRLLVWRILATAATAGPHWRLRPAPARYRPPHQEGPPRHRGPAPGRGVRTRRAGTRLAKATAIQTKRPWRMPRPIPFQLAEFVLSRSLKLSRFRTAKVVPTLCKR
jgi:ribosome-associated heat shock protein Hsp15